MQKARTEREKIAKRMAAGDPPCSEAQADGVPCDELDRDCEDCGRAESTSEEWEQAGS